MKRVAPKRIARATNRMVIDGFTLLRRFSVEALWMVVGLRGHLKTLCGRWRTLFA